MTFYTTYRSHFTAYYNRRTCVNQSFFENYSVSDQSERQDCLIKCLVIYDIYEHCFIFVHLTPFRSKSIHIVYLSDIIGTDTRFAKWHCTFGDTIVVMSLFIVLLHILNEFQQVFSSSDFCFVKHSTSQMSSIRLVELK